MGGAVRDAGAARNGLRRVYAEQQKYAQRTFHRDRFGIACALQILAAVFGPWTPLSLWGSSIGVLVPFLPWIAFLVLLFAILALWQSDLSAARIGGSLGLLLFPLFFIGTFLSLLSLVILRTVETSGPRAPAA